MRMRLPPSLLLIGIVIASLLVVHMTPAQGIDVNPSDGLVRGIWNVGDSPFHVKEDITVGSSDSLTIQPGVTVYFDGYYRLIVQGKLIAVGTQGNNVTFARAGGGNTPNMWGGILLYSVSNPSTISYCTIMNARIAIASYGSNNNILTFNTIAYHSAGILINAALGNSIIHNEIYGCSDSAICLQQGSQNNNIAQNLIHNIGQLTPLMGEAIVLNGTLGSPMNQNNQIQANTIHDCYLSAIRLDHTQNLQISGNIIYYNYQRGGVAGTGGCIYLKKSGDTNLDYDNKDVTIYNNRLHSAAFNGTGIFVESARNVQITYNDIYLNAFAGIVLGDKNIFGSVTTLCQVSYNSIRNNGLEQGYDNGVSNTWDANYWSGYFGSDPTNSGIGNVPYVIPGPKGNKDYHPRMSVSLVMVLTSTTTMTNTGTLLSYVTTTTTTVSTWTATTTPVPVTSTSYIYTVEGTTTSTSITATTIQPYTLSAFSYSATSTSYIWTISVSTSTTSWATGSTSAATTITTTSVSTSYSTTSTTTTTTTTATATQGTAATSRRCIIASAAYESDLEPHVQFLREFRDQRVASSFLGSQFMNVFNSFYYSFSPAVAEAISTSESARAATRGVLSPLLGSLYVGRVVFDLLSAVPDLGIVAAGLLSTALIGILYASPLIAVNAVKGEKKRKRNEWSLKPLGLVWIGSLLAVGLSYVLLYIGATSAAEFVAMVSTGTLVLSTMILSPLLLLKLIRKLWRVCDKLRDN